jgi:asparagine synthase (glutamine-hydrolysing)
LSPPATLNPKKKLSTFVEDTLRSPVLGSIPFFDQRKVIALLDGLDGMAEGSRITHDQILMTLVSACVLQDRFHLTA